LVKTVNIASALGDPPPSPRLLPAAGGSALRPTHYDYRLLLHPCRFRF